MNLNKFNEILDLPREIGTDIPKITMLGFNEVLIENYKGILGIFYQNMHTYWKHKYKWI